MSNSKPVAGFNKNPQNINREGRPKGISITEMVKEALEEKDKTTGKYWKDLLIDKIFKKAIKNGDQIMLKAIWSYIDGMPRQKIDADIDSSLIVNLIDGGYISRPVKTDAAPKAGVVSGHSQV